MSATKTLVEFLIERGQNPEDYTPVIEALKNVFETRAPWYRHSVLDIKRHKNVYFVLVQTEHWSAWEGAAYGELLKFEEGKWRDVDRGRNTYRIHHNFMPKAEHNKIEKIEKAAANWEIALRSMWVGHPPKIVVLGAG